MKLDFGCGEQCNPGFLGVDIRSCSGVAYVCNAWEITRELQPDSVEEIYSRHFLEHLTFPQVDRTLSAWHQILKPSGTVEILVPNIMYHIRQYLGLFISSKSAANKNWSLKEHAIAGFWGWQREADSELWDVHKSGFDFNSLSHYLTKHRFASIERIKNRPWHLHMTARKH